MKYIVSHEFLMKVLRDWMNYNDIFYWKSNSGIVPIRSRNRQRNFKLKVIGKCINSRAYVILRSPYSDGYKFEDYKGEIYSPITEIEFSYPR